MLASRCLNASLLLLLLLGAGCYDPSRSARFYPQAIPSTNGIAVSWQSLTNEVDPGYLKAPADPFRLGPGDRVEVELLGDVASRTLCSVGPDGKIYFYLLPGVDVWGMTLGQAKAALEQELGRYIVGQRQVSLTLRNVESQRVWLLGRFSNPGVYSMPGPMTVLEAISLAGGAASLAGNQQSGFAYSSEELADFRRAFIMRKGQPVPVDFYRLLREGDLSQNVYLQPDDFVYFPTASAREVYVLGAVYSPRALPYNEEMTVIRAIAYAQGTIREAYLHHIALVRGSVSSPQIAILDYYAITSGQARDVLLQPQDIIYVPFQPYRYLRRYADLIMQTFVSSVAINEGANAALKQETPPAGVFIPVGSRITVSGGTPIR